METKLVDKVEREFAKADYLISKEFEEELERMRNDMIQAPYSTNPSFSKKLANIKISVYGYDKNYREISSEEIFGRIK